MSRRSARSINEKAESLARRLTEAMSAYNTAHGRPALSWEEVIGHAQYAEALIAGCLRVLEEKERIDRAWFAWRMAGHYPDDPCDPEAPLMPRETWP